MTTLLGIGPAGGRAKHTGSFADLADGRCHYRDEGPRQGACVLLIHGATVPAWEFDRLVPFLHRAGLRTVRADLYGHGLSDRPHTRYDQALFVRQQLGLLDHLGLDNGVSLVGHSLGSSVAARLLAARPKRFTSAVLTAPLVDYTVQVPATRALRLPLLGEALMAGWVVPMLKRRRRRNYSIIEDGRFARMFEEQLYIPGFGRALLSMFRAGALDAQHDAYEAIAGLDHPVMVMRGRDDAILPVAQLRQLAACLPRAHFEELADTAHAFLLTHPERTAPLIVEFLAATTKQRN